MAETPHQKTKPLNILAAVLVIAIFIAALLIGSGAWKISKEVAGQPSISVSPTVNPAEAAKAEADKKAIETLAKIQLINPNIQQSIIDQPELHVTVKNNTGKVVDGIVVEARFTNNFGDSIKDWSGNAAFHGNDQDVIQSGASKNDTWSLFQFSNATKVTDIRVVRIHFADGTSVLAADYSNN